MVKDLFGYVGSDNDVTLEKVKQINGLKVEFDFISSFEEKDLLYSIDKNEWLTDLKRRVQHFGYKYDYRARRIDKTSYIGKIPEWMIFLYKRLQERNLIAFDPDQAIVNEYTKGQGIAAHIDCEPCFGNTIISVSLGSQCVMDFQRDIESKEADKLSLLIKPRTLIVMTGESRYLWYHGISARNTDKFNGCIHERRRRVSITFRKVILDKNR